MKQNIEIKTFEDICSDCATWIIEYRSSIFEMPIFLIWYTNIDENNTDRVLTFQTGQIFTSSSLACIKYDIINNFNGIMPYENLNEWLNRFVDLIPVVNYIYDIDSICNSIKTEDLDVATLEKLANFINLFDDFINQDERNENLQIYRDNEFIVAAWHYYYDYIFLPKFNDSDKFAKWDRPKLMIDNLKLLAGFLQLKQQFENKIG